MSNFTFVNKEIITDKISDVLINQLQEKQKNKTWQTKKKISLQIIYQRKERKRLLNLLLRENAMLNKL